MSDTKPRLALVTGGVRRLGAHISARLAKAGYALALHGNRNSKPDTMLSEALDEQKTRWHGFTADFGEAGAAAELMDAVSSHFGQMPDLIVNNASLFDYDDPETITEAAMERHMRINMLVPVMLTTLLAKKLADGERAAVINIVDQRVRNPNGDQLSYTLSKQALAESVRTLAVSCADKLRVNGVAPGLTLPTKDYTGQQMTNLAAAMPLDRLSSPDDVAAAVLYLAEADSVTGQIIFADGGAHMTSFERDFIFMATK